MDSRQIRILVCDDDAVLLRMIELSLKEEKLGEVMVARNGREAMDILRTQNFDLVVTDIHMPHYQGEDILNLLRQEQRKNTPIIMMSSDGDEDVIAIAKKLGVNEFVKKPIMRDEIRALVEVVVRQVKSMLAGSKAH
jgi:DNA-binding response OmpR family regulator